MRESVVLAVYGSLVLAVPELTSPAHNLEVHPSYRFSESPLWFLKINFLTEMCIGSSKLKHVKHSA